MTAMLWEEEEEEESSLGHRESLTGAGWPRQARATSSPGSR